MNIYQQYLCKIIQGPFLVRKFKYLKNERKVLFLAGKFKEDFFVIFAEILLVYAEFMGWESHCDTTQ